MEPVKILNIDGAYSLVFDCGTNPSDPAIAEAGHEPNGYFWEGVVQFGFAAAGDLELDAEGSMFSALGSQETLAQLEQFLTPLLANPAHIADLITRAEQSGFTFDD